LQSVACCDAFGSINEVQYNIRLAAHLLLPAWPSGPRVFRALYETGRSALPPKRLWLQWRPTEGGERFFNKIKHCRRVATRYDKLAVNDLAFVQLASIRLWLRIDESTYRR
jgi:hypothetical protein